MPPWNTGNFIAADMPDVAHQAVGHAAGGAARHRCRRQQFAPRRNAVGRTAAREDGHVAGLEVVHQPDLEFVGVLAFEHRIGFGVKSGASAADERERVIERSHERPQCLIRISHLVHDVGKDRSVERLKQLGRCHGKSPPKRWLM